MYKNNFISGMQVATMDINLLQFVSFNLHIGSKLSQLCIKVPNWVPQNNPLMMVNIGRKKKKLKKLTIRMMSSATIVMLYKCNTYITHTAFKINGVTSLNRGMNLLLVESM